MLTDLYIRDFAIIHELSLPFDKGMTVITGETGAGKSIMLDALSLVLGARCQHDVIRASKESCEITACFSIDNIPAAQHWLAQEALASEGDCILRRIIAREGRGKHTINGHPVTQQQLRTLGQLLLHMHGQQEHQSLLKKNQQQQTLDTYGNYNDLLHGVKEAYLQWRTTHDAIENLQEKGQDKEARLAILAYQVKELKQLHPQTGEIEQLHTEQKQLANSQHLLSIAHETRELLSDGDNAAIDACHQAQRLLHTLTFDNLASAKTLLQDATIQLEEAYQEMEHFFRGCKINPARLAEVEQRLDVLYDCARKHRCTPEALPDVQHRLLEEQAQLEDYQQQLDQLLKTEQQQREYYNKKAKSLSDARQKAAATLSQQVTKAMQPLGMKGGIFTIQCHTTTSKNPSLQGNDDVTFFVSANPGQPEQPLHQVASGGELSRISLAIQVITAQETSKPTLIFDEVDTGIGGGTAAVVGQLLRELGEKQQLLCITHLPQVASQGHQHYRVEKYTEEKHTLNRIVPLSLEQRTQEIARMLGGLTITQQTLAHAKEMLENV